MFSLHLFCIIRSVYSDIIIPLEGGFQQHV
eukprot:COSAG03_NODE_200_length_10751_cov_2.905745_8_plen_30_part_00